MKKKWLLYTGVALLMLGASDLCGQQKSLYNGNVRVALHTLEQRGDSLYVDMALRFGDDIVRSGRRLEFSPVLTTGMQSTPLPKVMLFGRRAYKEYVRDTTFADVRAVSSRNVPYIVVKGYGRHRDSSVTYRYTLPFQSWIKSSWLEGRVDLVGCGNTLRQLDKGRLADSVTLEIQVEPYTITPHLAYMVAEVEQVKRREIANESFLDFAVGKTDIRPEFGNNPAELAKVRRMIEQVRSEQGGTITGIDITGYASPEGSLASNQRLSEGRALSLLNYLRNRYSELPRELYHIYFGGEDWDGLVKLVKASDMPDKEPVLAIIEHVGILEGRERRLMDLYGGVPYRYMLREMFPSLRRVLCRVNYAVKNFDVEEAKEVIKTRPQNLSLNEMYTVANTYEPGTQEFNDIFETAVRLYPNDPTAQVNAAVAALGRGDTVSAARYLGKVNAKMRIPEYDNAKGVLEMLRGEYDRAESYLQAASDAGVEAAARNLEELARKRENIELLRQQEND